jgi:DNA modification methylase
VAPTTDLASPTLVRVDEICPNDANPRLYLRDEVVTGICAQLLRDGGFPPWYAVIVRPRPEGGYELLAGHHRYVAVLRANEQDAGIGEIPAWVVHDLSDKEASRLQVLSNLQTGLTDLELGLFLLQEFPELKGRQHYGRGRQGGLRQCGREFGMPESRLRRCRDAAMAYEYIVTHGLPPEHGEEAAQGALAPALAEVSFQLAEIARVETRQLWPYLLDACRRGDWTVARTRQAVRAVRAHFPPLLRQRPNPPADPQEWQVVGRAIVEYLGDGRGGLHRALAEVSRWAGVPSHIPAAGTPYGDDFGHSARRLIVGDAIAVLARAGMGASPLPPASVDLVITSPPWYNTRYVPPAPRFADLAAYARFLGDLAHGLLAVLREGRLCCIHIADTNDPEPGARRLPLVALATQHFLGAGFDYVDSIVVTRAFPCNAPSPARSRNRRPSASLHALHDVILVFRRPGPDPFASIDPDIDRRWLTTVWPDLPVARRRPGDDTPLFRPEIPHRLIRMYSQPGDTVLDPFAGTGTTLTEAAALGRACIGIECRDAAVALVLEALPDLRILRVE